MKRAFIRPAANRLVSVHEAALHARNTDQRGNMSPWRHGPVGGTPLRRPAYLT